MSYLDEVNGDNLVNVVREIQNYLMSLQLKEVHCNQLSEISNDMGDQRAGRFLALSSGIEPTDPDANGSFQSAQGESFGEYLISMGVVRNGEIQFGFGPETGVFSGGKGVIDAEGITGSELLKWMIRQIATYGEVSRIGKLGMVLPYGNTTPAWELSYSSTAGSELITNGGAESGDFTGWTKTTENGGFWFVKTDNQRTGTYCFYYRTNRYIVEGLPPTTVLPFSGVLTSDRISITEAANYQFSGYIKGISNKDYPSGLSNAKIEVKWYDHVSAGNILRTDLVTDIFQNDAYMGNELILTAPSRALSCAIVLTNYQPDDGYGIGGAFSYAAFDDISMKAVNINQKIYLADDGLRLNGDGIPSCTKKLQDPYILSLTLANSVTVGVVDAGMHIYRYSFVDDYGETLAVGTSSVNAPGSKQVNISSIPTGGQTVKGRKIYRTKADQSSPFYLVGTINDNTTTTFVDNVADANLTMEAPLVNTTATRPTLPTKALVRWQVDAISNLKSGDTWPYGPSGSPYGPYGFYAYGHNAANAADGDWFRFNVFLAAGNYTMRVHYARTIASGKLDFYEDGESTPFATGVDLYISGNEKVVTGCELKNNGLHSIKAVVNGKNASSTDYEVIISDIEFVRADPI